MRTDGLGQAEGCCMYGAERRSEQMPAHVLSDWLAGDEGRQILRSDRRRQRRHDEAKTTDGNSG
jgi:hypothetical protein